MNGSPEGPVKKCWNTRLGIATAVVTTVFVIAVLTIPTLDPPGAREEADALGYIRSIGTLERAHRAAKGSVTCDWAELAAAAPMGKHDSFLGIEQSSLRTAMQDVSLHFDPERMCARRNRYYDNSGSAEACLTRKHPLN